MLSTQLVKKGVVPFGLESQHSIDEEVDEVDDTNIERSGFILRRTENPSPRRRKAYFTFLDPVIGGMDPFNNLEMPHDGNTARALNHWVYHFQQTRAPMSPRPLWLRNSISDPTLLASTIACSQSHIMFLQGITKPTPAFISQKLKAIQAINRELSSPRVSDYTIISVAALALLECLAGTPAACIIHRRGLELLVRNRGGLENLGLEGMTERIVSWADTCCSIILRSRPRFLLRQSAEDEEWFLDREQDISVPQDLKRRLRQLTRSSGLSECIARIWIRLRQLSEFIDSIPAHDTTALDEALFSDKLDLVEREVLRIIHSSALARCPGVAFLTAFLNAALIYTYQELREIPKFSAVGTALAGRIHSGLQMLDLDPLVGTCPDLLLWTLALGRAASPLGGPDRGWFFENLDGLTRCLGVYVQEQLVGLWYFRIAGMVVQRPKIAVGDQIGDGGSS